MVGFQRTWVYYILGRFVEAILQEVFPMSRVNETRKEISSFTQDEDEKFFEYWG
jgi:hypothetical protein